MMMVVVWLHRALSTVRFVRLFRYEDVHYKRLTRVREQESKRAEERLLWLEVSVAVSVATTSPDHCLLSFCFFGSKKSIPVPRDRKGLKSLSDFGYSNCLS